MSHANARLTPHGRWLLVQRVRVHGRPVAHVARELGISRQCAHRWVARFDAHGRAGLVDRSSLPRTNSRSTSPERVAAVLARRAVERCGPDALSRSTGVPARAISRILRRSGMPYLWQCDPLTGDVIRASKVAALRYEHPRPGNLVHVDVKKIGRIPNGGGWRATGRAAGSTARRRNTRVGFDYVHSAVDDHSRVAYSEILTDEKAAICAAFIDRALTRFAAIRAPVRAVLTDNHWSYAHSLALREVLAGHGTEHWFIKAHCPWQNGKVERFNRTLAPELGLPQALPQQRRTHRGLHNLARALQH